MIKCDVLCVRSALILWCLSSVPSPARPQCPSPVMTTDTCTFYRLLCLFIKYYISVKLFILQYTSEGLSGRECRKPSSSSSDRALWPARTTWRSLNNWKMWERSILYYIVSLAFYCTVFVFFYFNSIICFSSLLLHVIFHFNCNISVQKQRSENLMIIFILSSLLFFVYYLLFIIHYFIWRVTYLWLNWIKWNVRSGKMGRSQL